MTRAGTRQLARVVRERPGLVVVVMLGLAVRAVLLPRGHGQDFTVWDQAAAATLRGTNIYAHHPAYPGGPYAYLPLFLYVELPMYWLAVHAHLAFTVLGKLPIVAADVACAVLVDDAAEAAGASRGAATTAAAAFFLNPLVLYNSAYYGRFDTLACALLLLAVRALGRTRQAPLRSAAWYALAIAAKTFPAFAAAGMLRAAPRGRVRATVIVAAVLAVLTLPYLRAVHPLLQDVLGYNAEKVPQGLSWQTVLVTRFDAEDVQQAGTVLFAVFAAATVWLTRIRRLEIYILATLLLFLCVNKVVLEQYLVWPLAWLAIAGAGGAAHRRVASAVVLAVLTFIGCVDNESFHPYGRSSLPLAALLVAASLGYIAVVVSDRDLHPAPGAGWRAAKA